VGLPEGVEGQHEQIIQELKRATYGREFRERLRDTNQALYPDNDLGKARLKDDVERARKALDTVVSIHGRSGFRCMERAAQERDAAQQRDAADEGQLETCGSTVVGTVIVNQGEVVRPSQLIASVGPTKAEKERR